MYHETGGTLDSIDLKIGLQSTTLPGGGWNYNENSLGPNELLKFPGGQRFYSFNDWNKMRYTGLPHIGFAYSFGSKGAQYVKAVYEQVFNNGVIVNMDYIKCRSNGFLRFGDFSHNDVQLQVSKFGKFYSFEFKGSFENSNVAQNGGLLKDSLANSFPLIFLPVRKENARLDTKRIRLFQSNYFDFNKDSIKAFGLFTQHALRIKKYNYSEQSDTLSSIYSIINFDSLETYDQHQWSQVSSGAGVFMKNKFQMLKAGVDAKFWNFQNLGLYRDTLEIAIFGNYNYSKNNLSLTNDLEINVIGAKNELSEHFAVNYRLIKTQLSGQVHFENKLPDYYQRYAIGNNYQTNLLNPDKQVRFQPSVTAKREFGPMTLTGKYSFTQLKDNYFFISNTWRNDTLNSISFQQISLRINYKFKSLNIQPNYIYTQSPKELNITPTHQLQARIYVKGALFKAKKMVAYVGVDFALVSSFQPIGISSNTSTFKLDEFSNLNNGFTNLHFFGGFKIDEFKFFVRFENIGYFWNDRNIEMAKYYPIPSAQLRIGITWDFFN